MTKRINECIITPQRDIEFLLTLINLNEGKLETYFVVEDKYRKPIEGQSKGTFLISFGIPINLFIFDAFIQFDKFILPFSKKYYEKLENSSIDKIMDSSTIKELVKKGILSFSDEQIFKDEEREREEKCVDLINKSLENTKYDYIRTYSILRNPDNEDTDWLRSNNFLNSEEDPYTSNNWIYSIDINRLLFEISQRKLKSQKKFPIPIGIYPLKFEKENSIYFDTETMSWSLIIDKLANSSFNNASRYILNEFNNLKSELRAELEKKSLLQADLEYETPFGLSLILSELPDNSNPSEMYDTLLDHRKDKNFIEFKKWLYSFEDAIRTNNVAKLSKSKAEIESVTNSLKKEYTSVTINTSVTASPMYLENIFEDILSGKPSIKTMKSIISEIKKYLLNRKPKHLQYIYSIGEHIITSRSLDTEIKRCFSKKMDSENLNNTVYELHRNLLLYSKAKEIADFIKPTSLY